jgi:Putative Flp pilus-assembly TadE/G-like
MLFVIGAMAALSIDVVALYTARSEAQLAADGAALAAARLIANSGATSDSTGAAIATVEGSAGPAKTIALQIAEQNHVGGRNLTAGEVTVNFGGTYTNPTVTVAVQKTNLPTFFARIWGVTTLKVAASATAEAYNPSGAAGLVGTSPAPVALTCVKPWLLPNIDPTNSPNPIFVTATGAINNPALLGYSTVSGTPANRLHERCITCIPPPAPPIAWQYYPGSQASFPAPTSALPDCGSLYTPNQNSIVGCVQTPIACGNNTMSAVSVDTVPVSQTDTANAVNCLTHAQNNGDADQVDPSFAFSPFEFLVGANNPVTAAIGNDVIVSSSLVTVPVFDVGSPLALVPPPSPPGTVQIVGFVQLFLNPDGKEAPNSGVGINGHIQTTIINMVGCGTSWSATPILGNGASPVAVRLISPQS